MLYQADSQQWFNIDCIESIDDYGYDIGVTLKGGRTYRVHGSRRDEFFAAALKKQDEMAGAQIDAICEKIAAVALDRGDVELGEIIIAAIKGHEGEKR